MFIVGFTIGLLNFNQLAELEFSWFLFGLILGAIGLALAVIGLMVWRTRG
jgi:hypothetical protein